MVYGDTKVADEASAPLLPSDEKNPYTSPPPAYNQAYTYNGYQDPQKEYNPQQMNTYPNDLEYGGQPTVVYWYVVGAPVGHTDQNKFIAKVLSVVVLQLALTILVSAPVLASSSAATVLADPDNWWIQFIGWAAGLFFLFICAIFRHTPVLNWISLLLFTLSIALAVACVVAQYSVIVVLEAFMITFCSVIILLFITLVAKVDLRLFAAILILTMSFLLWWSLFVFVFTPMYCYCTNTTTYDVVCFCENAGFWPQFYTTIGIILFLGYLMFDLSRLQHAHNHDEWMLHAINIYVDIIILFLLLLGMKR